MVYRGLCKVANEIKTCLWMQSVNPSTVSFLFDPLFSEIPIALKPTFFNMNLDFENFTLDDYIQIGRWCATNIATIFGHNPDSPIFSHGTINPNAPN